MVHAAVWYGDSLYYIGTTLSRPSGRTVEWFILRWKNGADSYEKLFSSDRLLTEIQFHGGILYLKAPRNYVGDNSIYYAVNIDAAVYTEIEVDGSVYRFGKDVIVKIDQTGAYFTNRFLEPIEKCSGEKYLGQVYGNHYYYLSEKTLYRTAQGTKGKAQKLAENIAAFTVCDGALFYMPDTGVCGKGRQYRRNERERALYRIQKPRDSLCGHGQRRTPDKGSGGFSAGGSGAGVDHAVHGGLSVRTGGTDPNGDSRGRAICAVCQSILPDR